MARSICEHTFDVKEESNRCLLPPALAGTVPPSLEEAHMQAQMEAQMETITARQRRIVEFISRTVRERGYPPTVREIGEAVGLNSSSSVHAQLANLERRGVLKRDPSRPRAMELQGPRGARAKAITVPLIGRVSAGAPILAEEQVEDYLAVPSDFATDEPHFALHVQGESMIGAGILDGDVVVARRQDAADDGDVVVAILPGPAEDEATVKRLRHVRGRAMLVPENPTMEPFELGDGHVVGRVVAVLRKL
jgi:repressor LexA